MLRVEGRRCVVIGGGQVALRRAGALIDAGAEVEVIAPRIDPELAGLGVHCQQRGWEPADLAGAVLVVVATDDAEVNERVTAAAHEAGALVNRADEASAGDVSIPAHRHLGPLTVAVDTGGISATAAAAIRDELLERLDPAWPEVLECIAPFRREIQQRYPHSPAERKQRLKRLVSKAALACYRQGGRAALEAFCRECMLA